MNHDQFQREPAASLLQLMALWVTANDSHNEIRDAVDNIDTIFNLNNLIT